MKKQRLREVREELTCPDTAAEVWTQDSNPDPSSSHQHTQCPQENHFVLLLWLLLLLINLTTAILGHLLLVKYHPQRFYVQ